MLPTLVEEPPAGNAWIHEIKYDGYRTQLHVSRSGSRAFTRNGHDWSHLYGHVLRDAEKALGSRAILDGELIIQDDYGRADFDRLRHAIACRSEHLVFYAFDLLWLDDHDARSEPLGQRKMRLLELLGSPDPQARVQYSAHTDMDGAKFFAAACELEVEGIVSKRSNSQYLSGRTRSWLKTKNVLEGEFIVIGWEHNSEGPAVALLARVEEELVYAGSAFITLAEPARTRFWEAMERLARVSCPLPTARRRAANWVTPEVRVRARHLRCSAELRHATLISVT